MNRKQYTLETHPVCLPPNIVAGKNYRISMLTERLIRLEYSEEGVFVDRATQTVLNRDFAQVNYSVKDSDEQLEIFTEYVHLIYNKKKFTSFGLSIQVLGNLGDYRATWHFGESSMNLGGTARTLDQVDGACELEPGLMSRYGFALLDDHRSLLLTEDGWVEPRRGGGQDLYFFGYGHDYRGCLNDFYYLCGKTPMLPRFALGNWWSRYYEYTEESYRDLMERFDREQVPFTVAVVDMDWHLVDIDPKYGNGWTGYTWNRELFPDPERFLRWLHERGMKVTLNVHPADGVRAYEEPYPQMARAMGIDPATGEPVNFDFADRRFVDAYFSELHHPLEDMGVDFWWLDWQQGENTKVEGLDPLWMLNHFHYLDSGRDGRRPMTFSRYAGPGSHRYPVGFSGDTYITWDSLAFQPYFTATASNIGYGWWSHDIGGHMYGEKNDEMAGRWLQLGVFSPVMRLHSTKNEFNGKEPWRYKKEVHEMMNAFLQLRHRMMPYLYTMNERAYRENLPIVEPMYYQYPEEDAAYEMENQYYFGSELIVAPITSSRIERLNVAKVKAWLPEGIWFDVFTGVTYRGGRRLELYRGIESIPVFARAGAIVPLTPRISGREAICNPDMLTLNVYGGANGEFTLYEDDNETQDYQNGSCVNTKYILHWDDEERQSLVICPARGELSLIPQKRAYVVKLYGCANLENGWENAVELFVDGERKAAGDCSISYDGGKRCLCIELPDIAADAKTELVFSEKLELAPNNILERAFAFLDQAEIEFGVKSAVYDLLKKTREPGMAVTELRALGLDEDLVGCILEILAAF